MADFDDASIGGGSESLSLDEGISALLKAEAPKAPEDTGQADEVETEEEAEAGDETLDDDQGDEAEADSEEQADPEDEDDEPQEYAQGRFASDDAKVRLEDGSTVTIAELKAGTLRRGDYTRKTQALADERKAFDAERTGIQQQKDALLKDVQFLQTIAQQFLPQEPDASLLQQDPIGYWEQKAAYDQKVKQLQGLHGLSQENETKARTESETKAKERQQREASLLLEKMPELNNPEAFQRFSAEGGALMERAYGFTPEELAGLSDHRFFPMIRDLMRYQRIQSAKPAAKAKTEGKPPVLKPTQRPSEQAMRARSIKAADDRLQRDRDVDSAVAALLARGA